MELQIQVVVAVEAQEIILLLLIQAVQAVPVSSS
jgi:hypothetical protein